MRAIKFTIDKRQRKELSQKIAELTGVSVSYCGPPTFAYQIS